MAQVLIEGISLSDLESLIQTAVENGASKALELHRELNSLRRPDQETLLTRKEAAKILGVSLTTLHQWTMSNKIAAYRISSRIRYKRKDVDAALSQVGLLKYQRQAR